MIAHLRGTILEKHPNQVILEAGGVGYDVQIPISTFTALGDAGGTAALRIYTHVREDALVLFGFATADEKAVFERLISVSGIGPEAGDYGAFGIADSRTDCGDSKQRSGAAGEDSRCGQENRGAHGAGAER